MARFMAELQGKSNKRIHRLGSKRSGSWTRNRGWNLGVVTNMLPVEDTDRDMIHILLNGGTNETGNFGSIVVVEKPDGNLDVSVYMPPNSIPKINRTPNSINYTIERIKNASAVA